MHIMPTLTSIRHFLDGFRRVCLAFVRIANIAFPFFRKWLAFFPFSGIRNLLSDFRRTLDTFSCVGNGLQFSHSFRRFFLASVECPEFLFSLLRIWFGILAKTGYTIGDSFRRLFSTTKFRCTLFNEFRRWFVCSSYLGVSLRGKRSPAFSTFSSISEVTTLNTKLFNPFSFGLSPAFIWYFFKDNQFRFQVLYSKALKPTHLMANSLITQMRLKALMRVVSFTDISDLLSNWAFQAINKRCFGNEVAFRVMKWYSGHDKVYSLSGLWLSQVAQGHHHVLMPLLYHKPTLQATSCPFHPSTNRK